MINRISITIFIFLSFVNLSIGQGRGKIDCDNLEKCQRIFFEDFNSTQNPNGWSLPNSSEYQSRILNNGGLYLNNKINSKGFTASINYPINTSEDFSIEITINYKSGGTQSQGLIWGFKDWDNYYYFYLGNQGDFKVGAKTKGLFIEFIPWTKSSYINKYYETNTIKINSINKKYYFSINGHVVGSENLYALSGNNICLYTSGITEVIFENLTIREDINNNLSKNKPQNKSEWKGNGSGFFINEKGYVATNYHVIEDAEVIQVEYFQKGIKYKFFAKVIVTDKQNDLAIIQINDTKFKNLPIIPYVFSSTIKDVGSEVFALGYPMANVMGDEIKFTDGKISSKTGIEGDITVYQISVPIQPGNSGGPLFDNKGNLVGITSSALNKEYFNSENVNYAIKTTYLKNLIDVMPESIILPNNIEIYNKPLTEKIKLLSDFIPIIRVK
jgi:S1-C subfamily serine protease